MFLPARSLRWLLRRGARRRVLIRGGCTRAARHWVLRARVRREGRRERSMKRKAQIADVDCARDSAERTLSAPRPEERGCDIILIETLVYRSLQQRNMSRYHDVWNECCDRCTSSCKHTHGCAGRTGGKKCPLDLPAFAELSAASGTSKNNFPVVSNGLIYHPVGNGLWFCAETKTTAFSKPE